MKADEHADAQQEWEGPNDGLPIEPGYRSHAHRRLVTGARMVAVPDNPSSRSQCTVAPARWKYDMKAVDKLSATEFMAACKDDTFKTV